MKKLLLAYVLMISGLAVILHFRNPALELPQQGKKPLKGPSKGSLNEEKEKGQRQAGYERFAEFHRLLRTPDGEEGPAYQVNYKLEELEKSQMRSAAFRTKGTVLDWKSRGPGNIPGRTRALIVMPNDPTGNTWLSGSVGGGIWKTTSQGANWTNITPDLPNLAISALALCQSQPSTIYAGTGEGFGNLDAISGAGIFKSIDGGDTWSQLPSTVQDNSFRTVNRIVVDPANPDIVVAAAGSSTNIFETASSGIYRSSDGGSSWTKVYTSSSLIQQVIASPSDFSIQYASVRETGVLKSTDAGITWAMTSNDIRPSGRIELAVSYTNPSKVAASAQGSLSGEAGADLYLTQDGGSSWAYVSEENDNNFDFLVQGDYDNAIMFHPFNDNIVYVAGVSAFKFNIDTSSFSSFKTLKSFDKVATNSFIDFINFTGNDLAGLEVGSIPSESFVDVEIRFGNGLAQKAARFTVNKQGAGVPAGAYQYRDYVEVPFQAWDVTNNKQLMVSFRDQQEDGEYNLIASNTEGEGSTHSREYLFIHLMDYSQVVNDEVAKNGGHEHQLLFNLWPVLSAGGAWIPKSLPESKLVITFASLNKYRKSVNVVADGYGEHTAFSGGEVINPGSTVHVDHHSLVPYHLSASDSSFSIISSNDGGVYYTGNSQTPGETNGDWTFAGNNMVTGQFYGVDKRPGKEQYIGGLQDNSTNISSEGTSPGSNAAYTRVIGGDGFDAIWNYADDNLVIGSAQFSTFFRSGSFGAPGTWQPAVSGLPAEDAEVEFPFFSRLSTSKSIPEIIFCVGLDGVYRSLNFGELWALSEMDANWSYRGSFTNVEVSKANSMIVWAGGAMSSQQSLQVSTDRGGSFTNVNNYTANAGLQGVITGIESHPFEDSTAFALFSYSGLPKVLRTKDLGATWHDISGFEQDSQGNAGFPNVAVYSLLVLPNDPSVIWAGTEIGIFETLDEGASWHALQGFPAASVWEMKVVDDEVVVATHGRGIFTAPLSGVPEFTITPAITSLGAKPSGLISLSLKLRSPYDSTQIFVNNEVMKVIEANVVQNTEVNFSAGTADRVEVFARAFKGGRHFTSVGASASVDFNPPVAWYNNSFDDIASDADFYGNGFSISKPTGFLTMALHSRHSYDNDTVYIFNLKTPVVLQAGQALFEYRDIAIIETGEAGSTFGDVDFYDYVVVEGSVNGSNWVPLKDGYDANSNSSWLSAYNSKSAGTESMYVNHSIDLLDHFSAGDTVIFRFRLFADQLENGWGWAIDDLKIQFEGDDPITAIADNDLSFQLFPNPAKDNLVLQWGAEINGNLNLSIVNLGGQTLVSQVLKGELQSASIDVSRLSPGLHVVRIESAAFTENFRFIKQ